MGTRGLPGPTHLNVGQDFEQLARGRAKKEALTILSRSLLKVIYHLLRTGASSDPSAVASSQVGS